MSSQPTPLDPHRELRWIADAYERSQQARLQAGERVRAVARERRGADPLRLESELTAIRQGRSDGPAPLLGQAYRRRWEEEQELARRMEACLEQHPAWPWLRRVRGVGPVLAARLVARLDVTKAATPSSFWAYCGLATVPGVQYRCATCGLTGFAPERSPLPAQHRRPDGEPCPDEPRPVAGQPAGVRVAQPKAGRGERSQYDRHAKKTCYLIGSSFLRGGGAYQEYYRRERGKLDASRPDWAEGRKHLTALRKTEKLFLAHLWIVWRRALGLPVTQPYAHASEEHDSWSDPWEMVAAPRPAAWQRTRPAPPARA